jgi:hypothetical protein
MPKAKVKKLEMVKVDKEMNARSLAVLSSLGNSVMPDSKKLKKLSRPALVKPNTIPIGGIVSGEILEVANTISSRKDMADAKLLLLRNSNDPKNPVDFLLPITGVIKSAVGGFEGAAKLIGQKLYVKRLPDGETAKYGGENDAPKKVYMFDVFVEV